MSLTIPKAQQQAVTLSQITNNLQATSGKYDGKSLRLHSSATDVTIKVHTSTSNIFGTSQARGTKRTAALDLVETALKNEFALDDNAAKKLLGSVCKKDSRITLGELKSLQKLAQQQQAASTLLSNIRSGTAMDKDLLTQIHRDGFPLKDLPEIQKLSDDVKNAATSREMHKALESFQSLLSKISGQSTWQLNYVKLSDRTQPFLKDVSEPLRKDLVQQLRRICSDAVIANTQNELSTTHLPQLTGTPLQIGPQDRINFRDGNVSDLLQLDQECWKPSKQGATGGVIIEDNSLPGGGAVLKFEDNDNVNACNQISDYISQVSGQIQLPVDSMLIRSVTITGNESNQIVQILNSKRNIDNQRGVDTSIAKLGEVRENKATPMKAMFVKGASDFSALTTGKRIQFVRTSELPQSLGSVMVLGKLFGLGDHVGIKGDVNGGQTNLSNLMINPSTGRLALIDFAQFGGGGRPNGLCGSSDVAIKRGFTSLTDRIKAVAQDSNLLDSVVKPGDLSEGKVTEPFADLLKAVFCPATEGALFNDSEAGALEFLTDKDRKAFTLNSFIGVIDSLALVANNPEVFSHQTAMFDNPQQVMQDIQTIVQGLNGVRQQLVDQLNNL